ncbi:MAG: YbaK/EbsC family protein [Anaerolineales bacterium]|jgi:Cys-tRNA(Pro) deacylase
MQTHTPVTQALDKLNIQYKLHVHDSPLRSLEQAARERGLEPGQIVRSLLFRMEGDEFVMVLVPGPSKVDWAKLRHYLGVSRVTTARPQEVEQITGYPTGAVSPFGLKHSVRLLADESICDHELISLGAGIRNAGIILERGALLKHLEPELGEFTER